MPRLDATAIAAAATWDQDLNRDFARPARRANTQRLDPRRTGGRDRRHHRSRPADPDYLAADPQPAADRGQGDRGHSDRRASSRRGDYRPKGQQRHRDDGQEWFRCRRCKALIGPTVSGGRHRNHCLLCLHSRHVDGDRPGDRAASCGALMAPVGTFHRPKGEQVILHRCLGCGLERHNRVAADDNAVALLRLPPVPPRFGRLGTVPAAPESLEAAAAPEEAATG